MTEAQIVRAAKAIERTLKRTNGQAGPWSLARAALIAIGVSHETSVSDERIAKTMAKVKRYRESSRKGWRTKKNMAAARQIGLEEAIAEAEQGKAA
jgi:hypothetical protein